MDIYSADLYTRSRASELRSCINQDANEVELDFEQIGFMSRSFADELCNIMDDMKGTTFIFTNRNSDVERAVGKNVNAVLVMPRCMSLKIWRVFLNFF